MKIPRIAALLILCGVALGAVGKSKTLQESASKSATQQDDIPKSIADSVSGTLRFAEGNFLGVAEAMPENKYSFVPKTSPDLSEKDGHEADRTTAELIKYLKDSLEYSNNVLATLTEKNALDR